MYVRENSILAVQPDAETAVYDYAKDVVLEVYELQDGATAETCVYSPEQECELKVKVSRQGKQYHIVREGQVPCKIHICNRDMGTFVLGTGTVEQDGYVQLSEKCNLAVVVEK